MSDRERSISGHYDRNGLFDTIIKGLQAEGVNLKSVNRADLAGIDEFHVRGAAVSEELASYVPLRGLKVLDVGCGLGGPCRMLAAEYDCEVVGLDLNVHFIEVAQKLTELVHLQKQVTFVQGSALDLPFSEEEFDVVWTQHVQMNIESKETFYSEIMRVLRSGGHFMYYDIFRKGDETISYPVPWADSDTISFLFRKDEMHQLVSGLGGEGVIAQNQTSAGIKFFENMLVKIRQSGPPAVGLNLLMGESTLLKLGNLLSALKGGQLELESGAFIKS